MMYTSRIITSTAITRFSTPPRISRLLIWALLRNERQREHDQEYHHQNSDDQVESPTHRLAPSYSVATWPQYIPSGTPAKPKGLRNARSIENERAAPRKERRPVRDADATSLTTSCRPCRLASRALPPRARPPPRRW